MKTASELIWQASGRPMPKWTLETINGNCATCGQPITEGVSRKTIESETYSQQADYMKYGDYNCTACAWLNSDPKNNHRNVLVAGDKIWWPMISLESATPERPQWLDVLKIIINIPGDTPVTGCLTTDPKPRLWPRYKLSTVASFGLYVHAPDYDQGGYLPLNLKLLLEITTVIKESLDLKYSKKSIFTSLYNDYDRTVKNSIAATKIERRLKELRKLNEFTPALLMTPVEKKRGDNESRGNSDAGNVESGGTIGSRNPQNSHRLL